MSRIIWRTTPKMVIVLFIYFPCFNSCATLESNSRTSFEPCPGSHSKLKRITAFRILCVIALHTRMLDNGGVGHHALWFPDHFTTNEQPEEPCRPSTASMISLPWERPSCLVFIQTVAVFLKNNRVTLVSFFFHFFLLLAHSGSQNQSATVESKTTTSCVLWPKALV